MLVIVLIPITNIKIFLAQPGHEKGPHYVSWRLETQLISMQVISGEQPPSIHVRYRILSKRVSAKAVYEKKKVFQDAIETDDNSCVMTRSSNALVFLIDRQATQLPTETPLIRRCRYIIDSRN